LNERYDEGREDADHDEYRCIVSDEGGAALVAVGEWWAVGGRCVVSGELCADVADVDGTVRK